MNLENLPKVGSKTVKLLNKLDINTCEDLLSFYPYKYNIIKYVNIMEAGNDGTYYVVSSVLSVPKVMYIRSNFNKLEFMASNSNHSFKVVIFNRGFLKKSLLVGKEVILIGKYNKFSNVFTASDIKLNKEKEKIEPVYHLTEGLKNSGLVTLVSEALKENVEVLDYIPDYLNKKYNFLEKEDALRKIHVPKSIQDIKMSKLKLIYEELFVYTFKMNYLKKVNKDIKGMEKKFSEDDIQTFLTSLNFELTDDQLKAIEDILRDLKSEKRMNRLVLGDVGSGKTIVAIVAILANFLSGYQATFMAPTEILAKQHYESVKEYFKAYDIKIALLTGSTKAKEKASLYEDISKGYIDVLIGTHALLSENLKFSNLGLVVTDEQHRFGVNQRNLLQNKGGNLGDVLYLSATPIPRTYALTIYGDLDLSQIKTKPRVRKEIITKVVSEKEIKEVLLKMWEELNLGHQVFVVSPLIMENDELSLNSVTLLKEKMEQAFNGKARIEILHGKLKQKEKDALMNEFQEKKIQILISTTVIEVGIDIPNASVMVIFNAERFGLATLHQLRGRIGRGDIQSYCYLVSNMDNNQRLKVMEESSDGFYIAEKDFEQRGQGDLFGVKQSGDMSFKIANLKEDFKILNQANIDAKEFVETNKYLEDEYCRNLVKDIDFLD